MAHTHTLLWSSFSSVRRVSLHLPMHLPMHLLLSSGRSSYFRMVFCSFHFLPIFLLAQILMRADLGDEPEHPLEVVISNPPGQDATRTPQLTGNVGQRSLHSARISEETRTADTATLCQTQKVSLTETRTRVLANGGQALNQLDYRGSLRVAASITMGCSLCRIRLHPGTVAGDARHIGLLVQPLLHRGAASVT